MARDLLRLIVNAGQIFCAVAILVRSRHVAKTEFRADLRGARIIAEQQDLDVWVDLPPTAQCIALDHVNVTPKRLRSGKKSQHNWSVALSVAMSYC